MKFSNKPSPLDSFKLFYEDMEKKRMKKNKKVTAEMLKGKSEKILVLREPLARFLSKIHNVVNKTKSPRKKGKKLTKNDLILAREQRKRGILGIGLLLVIVSITYSTAVILSGVDGPVSKIILLPQALFALVSLLKAFSKIYK